MNIRFTKMHSLGNDFMVIDGVRQTINPTSQMIQVWSDRQTGIGFDQCLLVEPSPSPGIDFYYRIFNANGHEVGQCGNGARCLALFLKREGLSHKKTIHVSTRTTKMTLELLDNKMVKVHLDRPRFSPVDIPMKMDQEKPCYNIMVDDQRHTLHAVNVGNPHAILSTQNLSSVDVAKLGQSISQHAVFPEETNVEFMQRIDKHTISIRVYERDCGETTACGSGALAAAAIARRFYDVENPITVHMPGGVLTVDWPDTSDEICLTGPATFVYDGITDQGLVDS